MSWMITLALALSPQVQQSSEMTINCSDPAGQREMNYCAYQAYLTADKALNQQWAVTLAELKQRDARIDRRYDKEVTHEQTLLAAQRAWLVYRDEHCLGEGFYARGGSMEPMLVSFCKTKLTEARTAQLKELVEE